MTTSVRPRPIEFKEPPQGSRESSTLAKKPPKRNLPIGSLAKTSIESAIPQTHAGSNSHKRFNKISTVKEQRLDNTSLACIMDFLPLRTLLAVRQVSKRFLSLSTTRYKTLRRKPLAFLRDQGYSFNSNDVSQLKKITHIDLSSKNLTELPDEFWFLRKTLKELNLAYNLFQEVPQVLLNMRRMRILSLDGNLLTKVSKGIINLPLMKTISLKQNHLLAHVPAPKKPKEVLVDRLTTSIGDQERL